MSAATSEAEPGSSMLTYSGARHRTGRRLNSVYSIGACAESIFLPLRVQLRIKHKRDCKRCFPPSPDFSSSTLTDLQKLTDERDQARDIAVRLEQENAHLTELVTALAGHGLRADLTPTTMHWQDGAAMYSWFCDYMSRADQQLRERCRAVLAAAPVDAP